MKSPLLKRILNNLKLYEFRNSYEYKLGDIITIDSSIYESLSDNNKGNYPPGSEYWIKLL